MDPYKVMINLPVARAKVASIILDVVKSVRIRTTESDLEIFNKIYNHLNSIRFFDLMSLSVANSEKSLPNAEFFREKGNDLFIRKSFILALINYNRCICEAPRASVEYGLGIANRSAVLFELQKYKECLIDIHTLLKTDYPEKLQFKVFLRQSKCYLKLQVYTKAREAIIKAKHLLEKTFPGTVHWPHKSVYDEIRAVKSQLDQISEDDADLSFEDNLTLPKLQNGENPNFVYASKLVSLQLTPNCNRTVIADADINEGDVLFVDKPYAYYADNDLDYATVNCHYCFKSSLVFIPCTYCTETFFCSDKCRILCWNFYHKWECIGLRKCLLPVEQIFALNILFRASYTGFKTTISNPAKYGDKNDNYPCVFNLRLPALSITDLKTNAVVCIEHIRAKMQHKELEYASLAVNYLITYTDYFTWLYARLDRPVGCMYALTRTIGSYLFRHLNLMERGYNIETVHLQINSEDLDKKLNLRFHSIGYGLYLSSSNVRRSCVSNATESYHGNVKVVRATQFIQKGTEIFIREDNAPFNNFCYSEFDKFSPSAIESKVCITCSNCDSDVHLLRFMLWLCHKCGGKALPIANTEIAICFGCESIFSLREYLNIEAKILLLMSEDKLLTTRRLNIIYKEMQNIYHKENFKFCEIYRQFVIHYRYKGDFLKSAEFAKKLVEYYKLLGATHPLHIAAIYQLSISLVKYCVTLRVSKSSELERIYNEAKENIEKTKALLEYKFDVGTVNILTNILYDYLESNNVQDLESILLRYIL